MLNLKIIIASTRPGRKAPAITDWFNNIALQHSEFNVEVLDLKEINLPFFDEPEHPRLRKYQHQHTKDWSAKIDEADAFVIVTSEYNYGYPATIKNAIDYLSQEWHYKAMGFVSYGGVAAGTRAVQMLKPVITALGMMPITESVHIPMFTKFIDDNGKFNGDEVLNNSANAMLNALYKWAVALKTMRTKA